MSTTETAEHAPSVIPAQLSFIAIYNPSLGNSDESLKDQIVFYSSKTTRARKGRKNDEARSSDAENEEENEKLRQVGLAQGMVDFAKNFADGKPVESIETEKSRIVLHELEPGWWILASLDLTRLPPPVSSSQSQNPKPEYSSREVAPPQLILQHLLRAQSVFLLHHATNLSDLWVRFARPKFCGIVDKFWTRFLWNWDVLLNGNPAVDIYNCVKLAAGGELGIGVGEEEWGSGEREVLEDFVSRTEGLVDLVVSRFGDPPPGAEVTESAQNRSRSSPSFDKDRRSWLGTDTCPRPSDGVIFSGVGAVSRYSLRDVSHWMEWIFKYGEDAYGVRDSPTSTARRNRRKVKLDNSGGRNAVNRASQDEVRSLPQGRPRSPMPKSTERSFSPGIPPPLIKSVERSLRQATAKAASKDDSKASEEGPQDKETPADSSMFKTEKMMKYLTLGYGSAWSFGGKETGIHPRVSTLRQDEAPKEMEETERDQEPLNYIDPTPEVSEGEDEKVVQKLEETIGKFVIGLQGDLENDVLEDDRPLSESKQDQNGSNNRIILRTLAIKMSPSETTPQIRREDTFTSMGSAPSSQKKLQVVVYLHQPFVFTFLFELHTPSLSYPSFYRSIHHQLGPLQKPLLSSTDPQKISARIMAAIEADKHTTTPTPAKPLSRTLATSPQQAIYDLTYDPSNLTVHTSIPNIPEPGSLAAEGLASTYGSGYSWMYMGLGSGSSKGAIPATVPPPWTRVEALNVHTQILNTYISTRQLPTEMERTCKTSRGWWVAWMRVRDSKDGNDAEREGFREAFLVRKSNDGAGAIGTAGRRGHASGSASGSGRWLMRDVSGSSAASGEGGATGSVTEGVGVDTRRYVEGLLSLNR